LVKAILIQPLYIRLSSKDQHPIAQIGYRATTANVTESLSAGYVDAVTVTSLASSSPSGQIFRGLVSSSALANPVLSPAAGLSTTGFGTNIDVGDIDGDGLADVMIGDPNAGCGVGYVYLSGKGFATGTITPPDTNGAHYGWDVAPVAGTRLFLIGADAWNVGSGQGAGQVFVYSLN
jgi:hypothetical protein